MLFVLRFGNKTLPIIAPGLPVLTIPTAPIAARSDDVLDNPRHPYTQRLLRCLLVLKPLNQGGYQLQPA